MPTPEQRIREFYGFAFPDDFFAFREFMAGLPRNALHDVCDMRPAFPFAVANGCAATDYPDHPAWEDRYYNDLPEFVTLFRGSIDGLHFGYFFDAPGELPPVVAHFYNSDTFQHDLDGDTIFEAVRYRLENGESSFHEMIEDDPDEAAHYRRRLKQTERLREKLSKHFGADRPETGEEYTDTYDAYGGRKTVADTWDDMGIVVPKGKYRKLKRDPFAAHPPQPTKAVIKPLVAQAKKQLAAGYPGAGAEARPRPVGVGRDVPGVLRPTRRGVRGAGARAAPPAAGRGPRLPRVLRRGPRVMRFRPTHALLLRVRSIAHVRYLAEPLPCPP